jgi:hypothetical protein
MNHKHILTNYGFMTHPQHSKAHGIMDAIGHFSLATGVLE